MGKVTSQVDCFCSHQELLAGPKKSCYIIILKNDYFSEEDCFDIKDNNDSDEENDQIEAGEREDSFAETEYRDNSDEESFDDSYNEDLTAINESEHEITEAYLNSISNKNLKQLIYLNGSF